MRLISLEPELGLNLCTAVPFKEPLVPALCQVFLKGNGFEAKTLCVPFESDERLLLL